MWRRRPGAAIAVLALLAVASASTGAAGLPVDGPGPVEDAASAGPGSGDGEEEQGDPGDGSPATPVVDEDGVSAGPAEVHADVGADGSSNVTVRVETGSGDGDTPATGASGSSPNQNRSAEVGAVALPEPDGRCHETPLARLYLVAVPGISAGAADAPGAAWNGSLEDPRDHPAWRCTFGGSPDPTHARLDPTQGPGSPDPGPARHHARPASSPSPTTAALGGEVGDGRPPEAPSSPPVVGAAAVRSPAGGGWNVGAVALAAAAALAVPAALVLYRRLTGDDLMENETRRAVLELVRDRPGVTAAEVARGLDVHYETARHHLDLLDEFGEVEAFELGGRVRYFENHGRLDRFARHLAASLGSETKREVLMAIARSGSLPSGEVADEVGVAPSTASYHLGDLEDRGLVEGRTVGRSVLYRLADGVLPALLELAPTPGDDGRSRR